MFAARALWASWANLTLGAYWASLALWALRPTRIALGTLWSNQAFVALRPCGALWALGSYEAHQRIGDQIVVGVFGVVVWIGRICPQGQLD